MPSALKTFTSENSWVVPDYVDLIRIIAEGDNGSGGNASADSTFNSSTAESSGGSGGKVKGDLSVSSGDDIYIRFISGGGGGSDGYDEGSANGGSGGDATDVRHNGDSSSYTVALAGGGGGGGAAAATDTSDGDPDTDAGSGGADGGNPDNGNDASIGNASATGGSTGGGSGRNGGSGEGHTDSGLTYDAAAAGGGGGAGASGGGGGGQDTYNSGTDPIYPDGAGAGGAGGSSSSSGLSNTTIDSTGGGRDVEIKYSDKITDLSGDTTVEDEINLSWSAPLDVDSYNIYRAEVSGAAPADYTQIASGLSASTESYTDTNLEDGEQYYYRVENVNSFDNRLSNEPSPITALPAATNLDGTFDGTKVALTWTNNDDSVDGDISIDRSIDDGSSWTEIASGLAYDATSYDDTTIDPGETALYRVNRNTDDTSVASSTVEVAAAGSVVIATNGLRKTNQGVVSTE